MYHEMCFKSQSHLERKIWHLWNHFYSWGTMFMLLNRWDVMSWVTLFKTIHCYIFVGNGNTQKSRTLIPDEQLLFHNISFEYMSGSTNWFFKIQNTKNKCFILRWYYYILCTCMFIDVAYELIYMNKLCSVKWRCEFTINPKEECYGHGKSVWIINLVRLTDCCFNPSRLFSLKCKCQLRLLKDQLFGVRGHSTVRYHSLATSTVRREDYLRNRINLSCYWALSDETVTIRRNN